MIRIKSSLRFLSCFWLLFAFGTGSSCFAQHTKSNFDYRRTLDSLRNLLKIAKEDTGKVSILNALSFESKEKSPHTSIQFAEEALKLAKDLSFDKRIADSYSNIGLVYKYSHNFEKALEYDLLSLKIRYDIDDKNAVIKTLCHIAGLYEEQSNFGSAMEYYLDALKLAEGNSSPPDSSIKREKQTENKRQAGKIYYSIGKLYQNQKNYDGALKYFTKALKIFDKINDENSLADVYASIGIVFYDRSSRNNSQPFVFKGLHKEAMTFLLKARKLYQKNKNTNGIIRADNHLAYISAGQEKFDEALDYGFEGLKLSQVMKNEEMKVSLYGTIGDVYHSQGNYKKALEYFEKCLRGAKAVNNKNYIKSLYLSFASVYAKLNNYKKAYEYHTLYSGIKETMITEQSGSRIAEINARYDNEKKDIELIKKDAELAKQLAETEKKQTERNAFIVGFVLILILAFFIYRSFISKKKANISITQKKEEIERSYKNISILSEIEQEITSSLSIEKIIEKVYENVNKIMCADVLCIGIPNLAKNTIEFPGFIERGVKYSSSYSLNDDTRFPVLCYKNRQEIFINDLRNEYKNYIPYIPVPLVGDRPESIIYLPLFSKGKVIGVITVESFKKNAYTRYHLDMLKSLAVYIAIALENAKLYENLEERVAERTTEVLKQKEVVEKSHENTKLLNNIGREIISVLSVEDIINKVYENVNKLMDASVFGIGIFNKAENRIEFNGVIENGEKLPIHFEELKDDRRPAVLCFKSQKELFTNDFKKDYTKFFTGRTMPFPKEGGYVASLIYLPLSTSNKQIGVITVQCFKENAYTEYQLDILRNLAIYVVNALENANLYENMEEEVRHRTQEVIKQKEELEISKNNISVLSEIGQEITSSLSIETIIEKIYENVNKLMDASVFTIGIYNEERKRLEFIGTIENGKKMEFQSVETSGNDRLPSQCFNDRKIIFISDFRKEYKKYFPSLSAFPTPIAGLSSESIIYIPLISKDKPIGVITVQSVRVNAFTEYHLNILQSMAIYAAIAIENAHLYENLEKKVEERTAEVIKQKVVVEKSYENTKLLSNIGREISSTLSVEEIINKVYQNVNKLMDAAAFGIGIFNTSEKRIDFSGFIEKGQRLPFYYLAISEEYRPAVRCFNKQQEIIINDFQKEYAIYFPNNIVPEPKEGEQPVSIIYLPLSTPDKVVGVITVQSFKQNAYTEYHLDILRNLAVYTVNALGNAHLYQTVEEEVKHRTQEVIKQKEELEISRNNLNVLSEIGQELTSTLDFESIFTKLHQSISRLMDAETFGVRIYHPENNTVEIKYEFDKGERLKPFSFSMDNDNNYSVWCIKNKKEIFINDNITEHKEYVKDIVVIAGEMTHSVLFCPMILKDMVIGVITVQSYHKNRYTKHHLNILRTLANYTAIALENAQLYEKLEEKIEERTIEVLKQKEEVEKSYENTKLLSNIGREITAVLSVEEIVNKVYENVNKLMDASVFGIAVFDETGNRLIFSGFIEKGEKLPVFYNELSEESRLAVWCFKNKKEIFINDLNKEYNNYFPGKEIPVPKAGEQSESIIYLPLFTTNKLIGVITVQSFKQNAYSEYQLNILRNLALYVVNGLENARLYEHMEDEVKVRTVEVEKQKDELARLSIVASETDNGVLIFDANGEIEWVNSGFTRLQGYGLDELKQRGNTLEKISHNPEIEALIQDCVENKKSSIYQALNITKAGKELWVQSSLTPILDETGAVKKWVIIDTDVTARKKAEDGIRLQNEKITDSINYAKSIQEALLPSIEEIQKHLPESFILFKPKDIVSGDFYWIYEDKGRVFVAVADCTGHGVPGAFMSLIGNNFLNDIVKVKGRHTPSEILEELNIQFINALKQNSKDTSVKYGMDIALISLQAPTNLPLFDEGKPILHGNLLNMQFAGAHSPILIFRRKLVSLPLFPNMQDVIGADEVECISIKGNARSIGSYQKLDERGFTNHNVQLLKGDMLYIFSDGFADQIGGHENKKIFSKTFKDLLQSICQMDVSEQKKVLDKTITDWKGKLNQTDDILVVGIRI